MPVDPAVWLSQQPGFIVIAERLGLPPIDYARNYMEAVPAATTNPGPEQLQAAPNPSKDLEVEDPRVRRLEARLEQAEKKIKTQEGRIRLLNDDIDNLSHRE